MIKFVDKLIYSITEKPNCYVEVKNPPKTFLEKLARPQVARQVQFNNWSKRFKIYSGSYLPENDRQLLKKGWEDKKNCKSSVFMQRKSTGQTVRSDYHNNMPHHYHWLDYKEKSFNNKMRKKFKEREFGGQCVYYNKYGQLTHQGDPEHHLWGVKDDN